MVYQSIITGLFLSICTYTDVRCRYVYRKVVILAFILSMAGYFANWMMGQMPDAGGMILSLLPGAGCFLVSLLSREALGYGDCMVITVCGISLGIEKVTGLLMLGLFLSAIWAIYLCLFRRADRRQEFPFVPFLLTAFVIQILGRR